ncbi:hypothetical protein [Acidovorax sp. NCPPB 3576]|uniref:hypothetical protein n=1 Tax=Acidovorax sp. NCPPB 3576 TaxID=2940488 RepID=UPI00234A18BE|nr:hypothetical protein [Acidovorax sp. NCPPB 3576]WCM86265.1 hypothetical protein M5C98_12725 [Acidovorax sp. NCPPB 3576]
MQVPVAIGMVIAAVKRTDLGERIVEKCAAGVGGQLKAVGVTSLLREHAEVAALAGSEHSKATAFRSSRAIEE